MNYSAPTITVLGNAAAVIKGSSIAKTDQDHTVSLQASDCELDD